LLLRFVVFALLLASAPALAAPLDYLSSAGAKADRVLPLTWGLIAISLIVILVIAGLLLLALGGKSLPILTAGTRPPLGQHGTGLSWLWIGVGISTLVLLFSVVWTMQVLAQVGQAPGSPGLTIEVTGRQWWWQVRYLSDDPSENFTTANEIHIPAGRPVRFRLIGGDVIHSFWVPKLTGKTDMIPGQTNETWLEASAPGTWRGQCGEYCGLQHAHMALLVVADTPEAFAAWKARQLAAAPAAVAHSKGAADFTAHCGGCHTVRGTDAAGTLGPDLSHLMQRRTIAAGTLGNDPSDLVHWLSDPQSVKPGALMQAPNVSPQELADIHTFLNQLD
jgi:cytochrome c oxidase subunit 2